MWFDYTGCDNKQQWVGLAHTQEYYIRNVGGCRDGDDGDRDNEGHVIIVVHNDIIPCLSKNKVQYICLKNRG